MLNLNIYFQREQEKLTFAKLLTTKNKLVHVGVLGLQRRALSRDADVVTRYRYTGTFTYLGI